MAVDYKYEFISVGRMKALQKASSDVFDLHKDMVKSGVIAPEVLERLKVIRELVARAANQTCDVEVLQKLFGPDLGEERK